MRRTSWIPALTFVVAMWWAAGVNAQQAGQGSGTANGQGQTATGQTGATDQGSSGQTGTTGQTGTDTQGGMTGQSGSSRSGAQANQNRQQKFVDRAAEGNMAEIQLSQLAVQRAQDPQIKQFAQTMVDEHTKALDQLKQVAGNEGLQVPSQLDKKDQKLQDKLSNLSGANFDKAYVNAMVKSHKRVEGLLSKEAHKGGAQASASSGGTSAVDTSGQGTTSATGTSGTSATQGLDQWAGTTLPIVQSHLQEAQQLQKQVKNEGGKQNQGQSK